MEESEDEEEARDVVLPGACMGRPSSSGWSSSPAQRDKPIKLTNRASEDSDVIWPGETEARIGAGTCPKSLSQFSKEPGLLAPSFFYFWDHVWLRVMPINSRVPSSTSVTYLLLSSFGQVTFPLKDSASTFFLKKKGGEGIPTFQKGFEDEI